jgi:hypothetical protein
MKPLLSFSSSYKRTAVLFTVYVLCLTLLLFHIAIWNTSFHELCLYIFECLLVFFCCIVYGLFCDWIILFTCNVNNMILLFVKFNFVSHSTYIL